MSRRRLSSILVSVACGACLLAPSAASAGYTFGPGVTQLGPVETVFDWGEGTGSQMVFADACERTHMPDQPARAFRDNLNRIQLNISHGEVPRPRVNLPPRYQGNRRMIGDTLGTIVSEQDYPGGRPCDQNVTHTNPYMPPTSPMAGAPKTAAPWPPPPEYDPTNPGNYHDREWINSMWAGEDGLTVYGFFHNNYQGWRDLNADGTSNDDCTATQEQEETCWYAAITTAKSTNGGATFGAGSTWWHHYYPPFYNHPPGHLVASTPYRYVKDGGRQGVPDLFTNLIRKVPSDGNYYMVFFVNSDGPIPDEYSGTCVMRTPAIDMPSSWRAWDGSGYNVQFMNPYTSTEAPGAHLCTPLSTLTGFRPQALTYNRYYNKYMLIAMRAVGLPDPGVYFSLSTDLINWEPPRLLMRATGPHTCADPSNVWYASVLDEDDPAATPTPLGERNFYQPNRTAHLYFKRSNNAPDCSPQKDTFNADLVRVPIEFPAQ